MEFTRRNFGKLALATTAVPAGTLFAAKPNSKFDGVQIATITYSYRDRPELANDAHELLKLVVESGISAIELMPSAAERFAGAPLPPLETGRGGGGGAARGGARGGSGRGGGARGGGGRGRALSPEQEAAAEKLKAWRLSASMDKFKEFRKLYNDAGVEIYCHKLTPSPNTTDDAEFNYFFEIGKALGATQLSLELPNQPSPFTQRMGDTALKHGMLAAYHAHEQATETAWDAVLNQSKGNAVNLDTGHYYAGTGKSPVPAIIKYHERIASLHLKDRTPTTPQARGANLPWGQGSTPIVAILQTLKKNKYKFPAAIELEYQIPAGSDSVTEVKKCVEYCKKALESA